MLKNKNESVRPELYQNGHPIRYIPGMGKTTPFDPRTDDECRKEYNRLSLLWHETSEYILPHFNPLDLSGDQRDMLLVQRWRLHRMEFLKRLGAEIRKLAMPKKEKVTQ